MNFHEIGNGPKKIILSDLERILDIVDIASLPIGKQFIHNDLRCYKISNEAAAFTFSL